MAQTARLSRVRQGSVYVQINRGVAPRDHAFPIPATPPSLIVVAKPVDFRERVVERERGPRRDRQGYGRCLMNARMITPEELGKLTKARASGDAPRITRGGSSAGDCPGPGPH